MSSFRMLFQMGSPPPPAWGKMVTKLENWISESMLPLIVHVKARLIANAEAVAQHNIQRSNYSKYNFISTWVTTVLLLLPLLYSTLFVCIRYWHTEQSFRLDCHKVEMNSVTLWHIGLSENKSHSHYKIQLNCWGFLPSNMSHSLELCVIPSFVGCGRVSL